jgi:glc operon protein GlcG
MYTQQNLSLVDAQKIIGVIQAELEKQKKGAAVAVVDIHGELIAFARTDGCPLASINISMNKAFTAAREKMESRALGEVSRKDNYPLTFYGELRYVGWGGGVPVKVDGVVVGGVGVSGLPEEEDMILARKGANALAEPKSAAASARSKSKKA